MIKRVSHIAVVVEEIEQALGVFRDALGLQPSHTETIAEQDVRVAFLRVGESQIELVEPIGTESGVARFLATRGEGTHHICLEVDDIDAALADLKGKGVRLIDRAPVAGARGRVAFVHPKSTHGVLIELWEPDREDPVDTP